MLDAAAEIAHLIEPVREHLFPLLWKAVNACAARHMIGEGAGVDSFSFGTDAWSLPARLFKESAVQGTIPFKLTGQSGCVLAYKGVRLRHHRVGELETEDIHESFPQNAKALRKEAASRQLSLPLEYEEFCGDASMALAFMANPRDGLCAVYLAIVGEVEDDKIVSWRHADLLWRRDGIETRAGVDMDRPPAEESPVPEVRLGRRKGKKMDDPR